MIVSYWMLFQISTS